MGNESLKVDTLSKIYEEGIKYLNSECINSFSGVRYYNKKTYQKFDMFSLNGTLKSVSGIEPYQYLYDDIYNKAIKKQIFK